MGYKVIEKFNDSKENKIYNVGDFYTGERALELSSNENKLGRALIVEETTIEELRNDYKEKVAEILQLKKATEIKSALVDLFSLGETKENDGGGDDDGGNGES